MNAKLVLVSLIGCASILAPTQARAATTIVATTGVDGFYTPDDGNLHAIVGSSANRVSDVTWRDGVADARITTLHQFTKPIAGVAGYYSPNDGNRHAIVALNDNTVWEVYYNSSGTFVDQLATINTYYGAIHAISGHVDAGKNQNVVMAMSGGAVILLKWLPGQGINSWVLTTEPAGSYDVASLCDDYGVNHAILAIPGRIVNGSPTYSFHDIAWTLAPTITETVLGSLGNWQGPLVGGFGAINWVNDSYDIFWVPAKAVRDYVFPTNILSDDFAEWVGSVATGAFYEANGWCPNRHVLVYTGYDTLIAYEQNACYPNSAWSSRTLGYGFNF